MNRKNKIKDFIQRHFKEIHRGGLSVFFRKIRTLIFKFLNVFVNILVMPIVILIRILSPLIIVRFGYLHGERIGHLACMAELYLCEREMGMHDHKTLDIFYFTLPICNNQLKKMWKRILPIFSFASLLDRANRILPGWKKHVIPEPEYWGETPWLITNTKPHLFFNSEEERQGNKELRKLGIPDNSPFICFHARCSAYLDSKYPERDWSYHSYRDCSIKNYIPAVEELTHRGYFSLRMGAVVKEKLNTSNSRLIDYAVNGRTDFLDIYLSAKCRFFICDTAGINAIPVLFRKPMVWLNYITLSSIPTWGPKDLITLKKLWLRSEHRFLTFREIIDSKIKNFSRTEEYEQQGIEIIENTPEEVTAVALEMDDRLNGTWRSTEEDETLQIKFWSLFKTGSNKVIVSRIGTEFLLQNRELLR